MSRVNPGSRATRLLEEDLQLQPRERRAEAVVGGHPERQVTVGPAPDVEPVRSPEPNGSAVSRR
jgi:hypothetical protein